MWNRGIRWPLKRRHILALKTDYRLTRVKKHHRMPQESILKHSRPSLSYHLSLRPLFCLFSSKRFRQVLQYNKEKISQWADINECYSGWFVNLQFFFLYGIYNCNIFIRLFTFVLYARVFSGTQCSHVRSKHTPTGLTPPIFINMQIIEYDQEKSQSEITYQPMARCRRHRTLTATTQ